jgi:Bifunctional DNA primase/polymerase, N-terminal
MTHSSASSAPGIARHGFRDATTDPDQIRRWWRRQPDANLAIATGAPSPDVLDARLPRYHLDFRGRGGYVLAAPSQVGGKPYRLIKRRATMAGLDWAKVVDLLEPERLAGRAAARPARPARGELGRLVSWVADLTLDGHNRNDGLFWVACRAGEVGDETVLADLAVAARATGLTDREIKRTIASARRNAGHQAIREGAS